jgi:hypothetical protein
MVGDPGSIGTEVVPEADAAVAVSSTVTGTVTMAAETVVGMWSGLSILPVTCSNSRESSFRRKRWRI